MKIFHDKKSRNEHFRICISLIFVLLALITIPTISACNSLIHRGPLTFKTHDFAIDFYSAQDVKISYGSLVYKIYGKGISREKTANDDRRLPTGAALGYRAFEDKVYVEWRTSDRELHSQVLDLDEIFKGKIVLHSIDPKLIYWPIPMVGGGPTIVVEVNDRVLNVYMDVEVKFETKNENSITVSATRFRTLAFTKTL
jgi:hypothetical protein